MVVFSYKLLDALLQFQSVERWQFFFENREDQLKIGDVLGKHYKLVNGV